NFGILMYSVTPPVEIESEWKRVETLHSEVHEYGGKVIEALKSKDISGSKDYFSHAESSADELIKLLTDLQAKLR
ncbi:MAG: hypothetical protein ACP5UP_08175, partial [Athalassotoga sp.]